MLSKLTSKLLIIGLLIFSSVGYADFQFTFNGHTYEVVTTGSSWESASMMARNKIVNGKEGYLVRIDDLSEDTEIFNQLIANIPSTDFSNTRAADGGGASYVWIGANDISTEGTWVWVDNETQFWQGDFTGSPVAGLFSHWGNEPDDFDGQDAAGIALTEWPLGDGSLGAKGEWNDIGRENSLYYSVEFDAVDGFSINAGLNDAWYDPDTDGQGFFITVFADLGYVSLAWFTYDTELPAEDAQANLGDPGHRWLTAGGPIDGNQVTMDIELTSGGLFDTSTVITRTDPPGSDGTIVLTFDNCNSGSIEYNIPSINRQGTVPIQRVVTDNVVLCEALNLD